MERVKLFSKTGLFEKRNIGVKVVTEKIEDKK